MSNPRISLVFAVCILATAGLAADSAQGRSARRFAAQRSCSDLPKDCKLPVRYLGEKGGCSCFACEYGQKTQHASCTNNKQDREAFLDKVRQSPKK
jgi:hypothetical protein